MSLGAIFCDNKYQKFLTQVFFLIHISTCFCCFPFNILGKEFMSKKKGISKDVKGFLVMWLWKHWTCISCTHALLHSTTELYNYWRSGSAEILSPKTTDIYLSGLLARCQNAWSQDGGNMRVIANGSTTDQH